jgi:dTDP-4-amino-4,6-dideoxy-D-glucose acyltransferase
MNKKTGFLDVDEIQGIGFAQVGENVLIDRNAVFYRADKISIGANVRIDAFAVLSAGEKGISIGNHVHVAAFVLMVGGGGIEVQDFAGLSGRVSVYSSNDDYLGNALTGPTVPNELRLVTNAKVTIGRHVVVGAGSVILPGVTLGEGSCVGALSLVRKDVDPFQIVAGSDGKFIRERMRTLLEMESKL